MPNYNKAILIGNLTRDVESKSTSAGQPVANFSIAVNSGKDKDNVDFFDVEAWGKLADICSQYLSKGKSVLVEGRLKQDRWEDDQGRKRSKIKIIASNVQFLSVGKDEMNNSNNSSGSEPPF